MSTDQRRALIAAFQAVLAEAARDRTQREDRVDVGFGMEPRWVAYERGVMLRQVNGWREHRDLPPVSEREVVRVEQQACGHSDYAIKYAIGCTELAMEGFRA